MTIQDLTAVKARILSVLHSGGRDMKRRRIRDIRNEELIDATIAAVRRRGFADVTMAEIAAEAGASAASINYYFGSKDQLLAATMRRLLSLLRAALVKRLREAEGPKARLSAIIEANFDDTIYRADMCSVWMQFWAVAPYRESLSRLHRINRARVRSHIAAELRALLPEGARDTAQDALQNYMDGVWLEAAQGGAALDAEAARKEALRVVGLIVDA